MVEPLVSKATGSGEDFDDLVAVEGGVWGVEVDGDPGVVGGVFVSEDADGAIGEADDGVLGDVFDVFAVEGCGDGI